MFRVGVMATLAAGLACGALAQTSARPVASLFKGGTCAEDLACAQQGFSAFLTARGEAELKSSETALRYFRMDPDPGCPPDAADRSGVEVRRYDLQPDGGVRLTATQCGVRSSGLLSATQAARLKAALDRPEFQDFQGAFPSYCPESAASEPSAHLLEVVREGRYRLVEWECEVPTPLAPLLAALDLEGD